MRLSYPGLIRSKIIWAAILVKGLRQINIRRLRCYGNSVWVVCASALFVVCVQERFLGFGIQVFVQVKRLRGFAVLERHHKKLYT